jgi:hypothetical protein
MKRFVLGLVFSLIATSASAAGIFAQFTNTDVGTAANSVPTTLWTTSIPASAVSVGNAMKVHLSCYLGDGDGNVEVKYGTKSLGIFDTLAYTSMDVDLVVTRITTTNGTVTGSVTYHGLDVVDAPYHYVVSIPWSTATNLTVIGTNSSPYGGGLHIENGGIER